MAWYRSGTISLTNGSAAVTGAGTAWILNASVGEALLAPDGKLYEISAIASDTSITLATAYLGATQAGQAYVLVPTQSYIRDLAAQAAALVNTYSSIANNAGAGRFGDGTVAAPGVAFAGDQDTGFFRSGNNEVTFVANGVAQFKYSATGGVQFLSSVDINEGTIDSTVIGGAAPAAGTFTTLRATGQIRSDASVLAAAGTPVYLGNTTDASVAEVSSPSPAVMKLKTAYQDTLTVSALTGNKSHTAFSVDTNSGASNCVLYQQTGDLKAIVGSQASIYGDSPNNYGTYLYTSSEYFVAIGGPKILRVLPSGVDVIGKLTTSNVKEDGAGNLAVGASAPKPWAVGKAIDVGLAGAFFGDGINTSWSAGIAQNAYASAYPGTWSYKVSGIGASRYQCNESIHQWFSAPAGNAGDPISFAQAMTLDAAGNLGLGVTPSQNWFGSRKAFAINSGGAALTGVTDGMAEVWGNAMLTAPSGDAVYVNNGCAAVYQVNRSGWGAHAWFTAPYGSAGTAATLTQTMTLDASGNLLVGATSGTCHRILKGLDAGDLQLTVGQTDIVPGAAFYHGNNTGAPNAANSLLKLGQMNVTGRSINAAGTINASGADYAEYERNNGLVIGKGSVVGFKADGTLTLTYAEAIRFGIKSTNPSYVGGDVWGTEDQVGKRPDQPSYTAPTYTGPQAPVEPIKPAIHDGEEVNAEADDAAYLEALNAYQEQLTAYFDAQAAHKAAVEAADAAHSEAMAQYEAEKAAFDARLEAARQTVDRIAYSGKVPVNVQSATPGGYIVAAEGESGEIVGEFVADPDFAQYKKAVGRVNRILEDGRCEVAVIVH